MFSKVIVLGLLICWLTNSSFSQTPQEINWLNEHVNPIESVNPDHSSDDLEPFQQMVQQATIVGLGECTHGSHEIFQMKHRLLTALVEQLGFTIFAIEADFAGSQIVNDYVQSGKGDSLQVLDALGYWTWYTDEVWQLIKWMKEYNQGHANKVTFTGFDMNVPYPAIKTIRQFALQRNRLELRGWIDELDTLYRNNPQKQASRAKQLSKQIYSELEAQMASPILRQCARTLRQYAEMRSKGPHAGNMFRDECMAANVDWLMQQSPQAKLVLWAHNGHIEKRNGLSKSMGYYLANTYGSSFASVGFSTGRGTYTALTIDPITRKRHLSRTNILLDPIPDSVEKWFSALTTPNFYVDLRTVPSHKEVAWLNQKKWTRNIGSTVPAKLDYQFTPNHQLGTLYDVLIYLDQTSASRSYLAK